MKKAQFQFAWIFAVIVGALILFLAFYFVGTTLLRQRYEQETIQAQSLDILLNPFAYLGAIGRTNYNLLSLPEESEVMIDCNKEIFGDLGYNEITLVSKKETGISKAVYDKYIFAPQPMKGKNFDALSKPLKMPWRIADVIILWPSNQKYCFVNAPTRIKEELESINIKSLVFKDLPDECSKDSIKVCFQASGCDINVYSNKVSKNKRDSYYSDDALMYAAIFSDPVLYDCNVKRLASRIAIESEIYEKKALSLNQRGCSVSYNLEPLKTNAEDVFENTNSIISLQQAAQILESINRGARCTLF